MADSPARRLNARIAALELHADPVRSRAVARKAREGFDGRFKDEALAGNPSLTGADLDTAIKRRRHIYFVRLAAKSAKARAKRNGAARR